MGDGPNGKTVHEDTSLGRFASKADAAGWAKENAVDWLEKNA
jgi:hypothetical protein